jgi:protein TonB
MILTRCRRVAAVVVPLAVLLVPALDAAGPAVQSGAERPGKDVTAPRIRREVKPQYTAAALQARIEGSVLLEAVVKEDGTVGDVRVTKSLDKEHGLDEEAVKALAQWEFVPGQKGGKPVAVLVDVEMTFTLKDKQAAALHQAGIRR